MKKNKKKKAFTLVELLAVIVILAVILVIAIPQITKTIKASRLKSFESSAKLIASNAEDYYLAQQTLNPDYSASSVLCADIAKLTDDYENCSVTYDANGKATVKLKGAANSKFNNLKCSGTKDNMTCIEKVSLPGYSDAVEYLVDKYNNGTNSDGIIRVTHDTSVNPKYTAVEYRYQGENPNNYVYFNCSDNTNPTSSTCEVWRIVGVFDNRVKLVRKDSLGTFSWDSSSDVAAEKGNNGLGINQWGASTYTATNSTYYSAGDTYSGADLMRELNSMGEFANTGYLSTSLSTNTNWYNGVNNTLGSGNFNKNYVLKASAQELIGDATWYTGGVPYNNTITLADAYAKERGEQGNICTSGKWCNDEVERTYTWTGKVGLIYASDFGYASGNSNCATNISDRNEYCDTNWMANYGWSISPSPRSDAAIEACRINPSSITDFVSAYNNNSLRPSVYLISGIQIKPSNPSSTYAPGSENNPYVFAE